MLNKEFIKTKFKKERSDWVENVFTAIIIGGFVIFGFYVFGQTNDRIESLRKNHLYAIATIKDYGTVGKNGTSIIYSYLYNDSVYLGRRSIHKSQKENTYAIGKNYMVIFNPENPNVNFFLPYPIHDSVLIKQEGWKILPTGQTDEQVFKYLEDNY